MARAFLSFVTFSAELKSKSEKSSVGGLPGEPGDPGVTTTNGSPAFNATGIAACPNQYSLSNLTTFSKFTLDGANVTSTTLPVELLYFSANIIGDHQVET